MLARKSLLIFLTDVLGALLGVVALFFIGRFFEPGPYGMVWFAVGLVGLLSAFTKLGFEKAHTKRIAEGRDLAACMGTYLVIKGVILAAFVVLAVSLVVAWEVFVGFVAATSLSVLLVIIVRSVLVKLRGVPKVTFDALRMTATSQTMIFVESVVRVPLVIVVTLMFAFSRGRSVPLETVWSTVSGWIGGIAPMTTNTGALLLAGAYVVGVLASFLVGVWFVRRSRIPIGRFDRDLAKSYSTFAWPVAAYAILTGMIYQIDAVMLGYFWTGSEVGFYQAARQFVAIVIIIPTAVRTLFFPMISELLSRGQLDIVRDLATTTQRYMSLVMVPILMLTILYANDVFRIMMSLTWSASAPALRLLVAHASLTVFTLVIASILLGIDRVRTVMTVSLVGFFLNVAMNFVFIPGSVLGVPLLGLRMTGAALASLLSKAVEVVIYIIVGRRILGQFYFTWSIPKHVTAGALAGGLLWFADRSIGWFQVVRVWDLAIASVVGLVLYTAFLFLMRELTRKDVIFFLDLLHPGHMKQYVMDEIRRGR